MCGIMRKQQMLSYGIQAFLIIALCQIVLAGTAFAWQNTSLQYCREITISPAANGTWFVELPYGSTNYTHFNASGYDIRFYNGSCSGSGGAALNFYRETWNTGNNSYFFVNLSNTATSAIAMLYGNNSLADASNYSKVFYNDADVTLATTTGWTQTGTLAAINTTSKRIEYTLSGTLTHNVYSSLKSGAPTNNYKIWYRHLTSAQTGLGGGTGVGETTGSCQYGQTNGVFNTPWSHTTYDYAMTGKKGGADFQPTFVYDHVGKELYGVLFKNGTTFNMTESLRRNMSSPEFSVQSASNTFTANPNRFFGYNCYYNGGTPNQIGWTNQTYMTDYAYPEPSFSMGAETAYVAAPFTINITSPLNTTYNSYYNNLTFNVSGNNATYQCNYSVDGAVSANFSISNATIGTYTIGAANGTHLLWMNCTNGSYPLAYNVSYTNDIGKILLTTWNEATSNYTQANITTILVYNSSASMNFTGNNFSWGYTELPGGNITIIAFFNNITREVSLINNATNYANVTLSFPALTGNYYFLIHNIYNNPIENALVSFYDLDGTLITQRYSQSDGYVYDIFLTMNIPVSVILQKSGYITKNITFTPYIDTILPVRIRMDEFTGNGTEYIPFSNVSYSCTPNQLIVNNNTLITCTLQESNSQLLASVMRVYFVNYSGSYLSKTTNCADPSTCTFTFTTNRTASKFRLNLIMNLTYGNYTKQRDYYTNGTSDINLPDSTDLGVPIWKFIFFVIMLIILAITWGYFGPLALLTIPVVIGIGVLYHVFGVGEFVLLLVVVFIIFMKMV